MTHVATDDTDTELLLDMYGRPVAFVPRIRAVAAQAHSRTAVPYPPEPGEPGEPVGSGGDGRE